MEAEIAEAITDLRASQQTALVEVAALVVVLYDHVQSFAQEVELIWRGPVSPITVLYILHRYLGNAILIAGLTVSLSHVLSDQVSYGLIEFEAWGTLMCVWIIQGVMQLRIFAMYHGSKKIGVLLGICFVAEIVTTAAVLWSNVGPGGPFGAMRVVVIANGLCVATGIRADSIVLTYVPVLCFDVILFGLAARISAKDVIEVIRSGGVGQASSLMKVLARDSLIYFLINLTLMIVTIVVWVSVPAIYGDGIAILLIDSVLVITNSRLVLGLRACRAGSGVQVGGNMPVSIGGGICAVDEGIPMHVLNITRGGP
ncbi:hypothetical protein BV22DRAFT_296472 [Leucogyrophana mollusca]|uniref:Uncharacterized protein n=1 Tax=Leucogyrophana mollusca TaxID=85980 RepID=A0ACB8BP66_9AGAM|nr:hypothetical protein BV22DRAFT_296472 [Leucogyrophana mollusca]